MDATDARHDDLTASLAKAYASAHYFVTIGHREWLFGVGQLAADVERELGGESYLFITAWNPAPDEASLEQNLASDRRLQASLDAHGYRRHSALGSDAQGGAVEHGWVVLDVPVDAADATAREFGQAGTLHWRRGHPVRLRMLWPRPTDVVDVEYTDWP